MSVISSYGVSFFIPSTSALHTWEGRQIHRHFFPMVIENVQHQGCLLDKQESSIKCNLQKMHQTVGNVLWTLVHTNPPQNMTQARDTIYYALATSMNAMCTIVATMLGIAPGSLAFAWDMFLNMPLVADWQAIVCLHKHHLAGNVADMSSHHSVLPCFGQHPTCRRRRDWESILVTSWLISRHDICKASAKLARWDRCLPMSSWASRDIVHVAGMSACRQLTCQMGGLADKTRCRHFQLRNIMSMRGCNEPRRSIFSMTTLPGNKFWRKCTIQQSWE